MFVLLKIFFISLLFSCQSAPSEKVEQVAPKPVYDTMRVTFSGDMMQHTPQIKAAQKSDGEFDYSPVFSSIAHRWRASDFTVVNLETTLSETPPYAGYPMFRSPKELLAFLKNAGVTTLALANNHTVDRGAKGLRTTIATIKEHDFGYVGASDTTVSVDIAWLEKGAIKVALLNYTYGTNGMPIPRGMRVNLIDTAAMRQHYNRAVEQGATNVVVYFHWGQEYQLKPNASQRELAMWCRELGVDWVIGSHPHVVQPIDHHNRIVYSLGNLCSNQYFPYTQGGVNVTLTFYSHKNSSLEHFSHWVDRDDAYMILMAEDSSKYDNRAFKRSLEDTYKILYTPVRYD